ncbi:MAG: hypothetical protein ABW007_23830 [Chitinophagaceae bacterium]
MKRLFLSIVITIITLTAKAQKGNNSIGFGADVGIPLGEFGDICTVGFGGYAKGLLGVGNAGQISLTSGYTVFNLKSDLRQMIGVDKSSVRIIPVLLGYRHNMKGVYVEPQLGLAIFSAKASVGNVSATNSESAFAWGFGGGYAWQNGIDLGVNFSGAAKDGSSDSWISFRLGYNISFRK